MENKIEKQIGIDEAIKILKDGNDYFRNLQKEREQNEKEISN